MSMQRIMRWGHDFTKGKGVGMLNLNLFGEKLCVMGRTHPNYQLPYLFYFLPNHDFCQKVFEVVIAGRGRVWEILIGKSTQFWSVVFCLQGQENTRFTC